MPRRGPIWLETAHQQYDALPSYMYELVDYRIAQLFGNPTGDRDAMYNQRTDLWSVALINESILFYVVLYAVVPDPARIIVLGLVEGQNEGFFGLG